MSETPLSWQNRTPFAQLSFCLSQAGGFLNVREWSRMRKMVFWISMQICGKKVEKITIAIRRVMLVDVANNKDD
jgi:hypothetical protein